MSCSHAARLIVNFDDAAKLLENSGTFDAVLDPILVIKENDDLLKHAVEKGSVAGTRWLLRNGCIIADNTSSEAEKLASIIDIAVKSRKRTLIELLFESGCNANNLSREIALELVLKNEISLCNLLDKYGYPFHSISNDALYIAALGGNHGMIKFLLEKGCRLDSVESFLEVCQRVHQKGDIESFNLLLSENSALAVIKILRKAVNTGNLYMCKHLLAFVKEYADDLPENYWDNALEDAVALIERANTQLD